MRTIAFLIIAAGASYVFLSRGPYSLLAEYTADVQALARNDRAPLVTADDLLPLPPPVQAFLRAAGVVGQPRVRNFRARMHGRIRGGPDDRWMSMAAEQVNVIQQSARMFYLTASMAGVPVQGYHRYVGSEAAMRIRAAALVPVVTESGAQMTQSETVTLLNDLFIFAPAALLDAGIDWQAIDARTVIATFTNAGHTIRARVSFNDAGELVDFVSEDRFQLSSDGKNATLMPWSTPVSGYRPFGAVRLPSSGEGRWHDPERGAYTYLELTIDSVDYNIGTR